MKRKGFTLIEALIVATIIGIIVAVAVGGIRDRVKTVDVQVLGDSGEVIKVYDNVKIIKPASSDGRIIIENDGVRIELPSSRIIVTYQN